MDGAIGFVKTKWWLKNSGNDGCQQELVLLVLYIVYGMAATRCTEDMVQNKSIKRDATKISQTRSTKC